MSPRVDSVITAALSHRWGLNHCFLSILKLQAINQKDKAMLKKLFIPTAATFLYCVLGPSLCGNRPVS